MVERRLIKVHINDPINKQRNCQKHSKIYLKKDSLRGFFTKKEEFERDRKINEGK